MKIRLLYAAEIPLLGIYPKDTRILIWRAVHYVYCSTFYNSQNIWSKVQCQMSDKKIRYLFSAIRKNEILPFILSEWN